MLDAMREHSKGLLATVLFGIIIAVFVINFGPQSSGCSGGLEGSSFAARVKNATVTESDFRYAFILAGGARVPPTEAKKAGLREAVMEYLIARSLLSQSARELGFAVTDE